MILLVIGPYLYYTRLVYLHIHSSAAVTQAGPEFGAKPYVYDFWIPVASGFLMYHSKKWITACLYRIVHAISIRLPTENDDMFDFKVGKSASKAWNALFHIFAALSAYLVMRGKPWHPWFLGGTGELQDGFLNMPFSEMDYSGYLFGLIIFGHPLQNAFSHFFLHERKPDFAEMSLHHLVHLCVSSSYLMANIIPVGIFIGFIHDISDILISVAKGFHLAGYETTSVVTFLGAQVLWLTMRLMALPTIIRFLIDLRYAEDRAYL